MHILLGLLLSIIGFFVVFGANWLLQTMGASDFAEKHLSTSGGSRFLYKLIGIGLMLVGFAIMTNLHLGVLNWIGRNLFGAYMPAQEQQIENNSYQYQPSK
jgi:hypothetical protein